jgi:hypothetical protein
MQITRASEQVHRGHLGQALIRDEQGDVRPRIREVRQHAHGRGGGGRAHDVVVREDMADFHKGSHGSSPTPPPNAAACAQRRDPPDGRILGGGCGRCCRTREGNHSASGDCPALLRLPGHSALSTCPAGARGRQRGDYGDCVGRDEDADRERSDMPAAHDRDRHDPEVDGEGSPYGLPGRRSRAGRCSPVNGEVRAAREAGGGAGGWPAGPAGLPVSVMIPAVISPAAAAPAAAASVIFRRSQAMTPSQR